jgi:hypothetical protein
VVAVEELHPGGELLASRLDDEVVVVAHQTERVATPLVLQDGNAEQEQEEASVVVLEEDRDPAGTARADVKDPVGGQLGAGHASHGAKVVAARADRARCGKKVTLL